MLDVDAVEGSFALSDRRVSGESGWHSHPKHQLLYAAVGSVQLHCAGWEWTVPPQRAAWLPAHVSHNVLSGRPYELRSLYFCPNELSDVPSEVAVFPLPSLGREMILYAMKWGAGSQDPAKHRFFPVLLDVCLEHVGSPLAMRVPAARSEELRRATAFMQVHLADPLTLEQVAQVGFMSSRTLSRRFRDEMQLSFRSYLQAIRIVRGAELLADPLCRVTDAAFAVGFQSHSAFSEAFRKHFGRSPSTYQNDLAPAS